MLNKAEKKAQSNIFKKLAERNKNIPIEKDPNEPPHE